MNGLHHDYWTVWIYLSAGGGRMVFTILGVFCFLEEENIMVAPDGYWQG